MKEKILNIGVIFGGRSGEHAVSLMSARNVLKVLAASKHKITEIGITREGDWMAGENVLEAFESGDYQALFSAAILPNSSTKGIWQIKETNQGKNLSLMKDLDIVFPILHGSFGEDGTIQGLFEMADIAYVGAGVLGSSAAMDKAVFFDLMRANDIPALETILIHRLELGKNAERVLDQIEEMASYPYFVKPANMGSSVGISKVQNRADLYAGLIEAAQYDRRIIIQQGLNVREIEVAVVGNDVPEASVCGEIIPEAEFYSYAAKYHDDRSSVIIPADISKDVSDSIRRLAIKAYRACDVAGMARVDFFIEKESQKIYINEINTIPGFTEISMFPMLWEASALSKLALIEKLINLGLERHAEHQATKRDFSPEGKQ